MVHAERCHGAVVNMNNVASSCHGGPPPTQILLERFPMYHLSKGELHRILRGFPLLKSCIRNRSNRILEGGSLPWPLDAPFSMIWQHSACTMGWRWPYGSISGFHHRLSGLLQECSPIQVFTRFDNFCRARSNRGPPNNLVERFQMHNLSNGKLRRIE